MVEIDKEKVYWRAVLKRVVVVVKLLCERGLPLRGRNEVFRSPQNGNFLGLLDLLAQFDNFLADHIRRFANSGIGVPSYLSSTICNEIVQFMAKEITTKIVNEVKKAKYYSITVDSTPDVTHVDQLTFIMRYVQDDGTIVERFLKFIDSNGQHDAELITNPILSTLTEYDINLDNCRGQSYDNASNLSGNYTGVQAGLRSRSRSESEVLGRSRSRSRIVKKTRSRSRNILSDSDSSCPIFYILVMLTAQLTRPSAPV